MRITRGDFFRAALGLCGLPVGPAARLSWPRERWTPLPQGAPGGAAFFDLNMKPRRGFLSAGWAASGGLRFPPGAPPVRPGRGLARHSVGLGWRLLRPPDWASAGRGGFIDQILKSRRGCLPIGVLPCLRVDCPYHGDDCGGAASHRLPFPFARQPLNLRLPCRSRRFPDVHLRLWHDGVIFPAIAMSGSWLTAKVR
jgi:hypothetical protein